MPALGLLLAITNYSGAQVRQIYDLSVTPPVLIELFEAGDNDVEGEKVYSVLGTLLEGRVDSQPTQFDTIDEVSRTILPQPATSASFAKPKVARALISSLKPGS